MTRLFVFIAIVVAVASCGKKTVKTGLYIPTAETAKAHNADLATLKQGRDIFTANCEKCHRLYMPKEFSESQWVHILDEMQPKAQITDAEKSKVLMFLLAGK